MKVYIPIIDMLEFGAEYFMGGVYSNAEDAKRIAEEYFFDTCDELDITDEPAYAHCRIEEIVVDDPDYYMYL